MNSKNKMKDTRNNREKDGKFPNKHVNHDPNSESSRAVFGKNAEKEQHW